MRSVQLSRAFAHPQQVRAAAVPLVGEAVLPRQRFLEGKQQRFVGGVEVDLMQYRIAGKVHSAGRHEAHRTIDLSRDLLVALTLRRAGDELLVPQVDLAEVGKASLGERAQQVECRRALV